MIGTGKMLESGYSGKKVIALKGFLKDPNSILKLYFQYMKKMMIIFHIF